MERTVGFVAQVLHHFVRGRLGSRALHHLVAFRSASNAPGDCTQDFGWWYLSLSTCFSKGCLGTDLPVGRPKGRWPGLTGW